MTGSGILPVDKEAGQTSHDVVALVRKSLRGGRVGHAGTLDPLATGLLTILVGQATRISEFIMDLPKVYRTSITLGVSTDTYDADGQVIATAPVTATRDDVDEALKPFVGEIEQTPPPYSAAKVAGVRAYRLARAGKQVALDRRPTRIYRVELLQFRPPEIEIEVECGKGTYIRSIAHDLGAALNCGAHVSALRRTRVGPFDVDSAVPVSALRSALQDGTWRDSLLPTDLGLAHLPAMTIDIEDEKDIRHGQAVEIADPRLSPPAIIADGLLVRGYAEDGSFIGLLRYDGRAMMWRPRKILS